MARRRNASKRPRRRRIRSRTRRRSRRTRMRGGSGCGGNTWQSGFTTNKAMDYIQYDLGA